MQRMQQGVDAALSSQKMLAAAACGIGGAIVVLLSFIGGIGDVEFLLESSYGWMSFVFYLLVVPAGYAIWKDYPFAVYGAVGLVGIEFALSMALSFGDTGTWPGWLVVLKGLILMVVGQAVYEAGDDEGGGQQGPYGQGPGPGGGQQRPMQRPGPGPRR